MIVVIILLALFDKSAVKFFVKVMRPRSRQCFPGFWSFGRNISMAVLSANTISWSSQSRDLETTGCIIS